MRQEDEKNKPNFCAPSGPRARPTEKTQKDLELQAAYSLAASRRRALACSCRPRGRTMARGTPRCHRRSGGVPQRPLAPVRRGDMHGPSTAATQRATDPLRTLRISGLLSCCANMHFSRVCVQIYRCQGSPSSRSFVSGAKAKVLLESPWYMYSLNRLELKIASG